MQQHAPASSPLLTFSPQAIERTFRGVSKAFASVFASLVPAGRGRLIIQRKTDRSAAAAAGDEDSEDEQARRSVENYTGVGISVSFNSKHDEQQRIQQLSGGQKSEFGPTPFPVTQTRWGPMIISRGLTRG